MKKIGIIGVGSIGSMITRRLLSSGKVPPNFLHITDRNKAKIAEIRESWPDILIEEDATDLATNTETILIAVPPLELPNVVKQIQLVSLANKHIISFVGLVPIAELISVLSSAQVTRAIPSIPSEAGHGILLLHHSGNVTPENREFSVNLFEPLGRVELLTNEKLSGTLGSLTASAPGVVAAIFDEFVNAAVAKSGVSIEQARSVFLYTIQGIVETLAMQDNDFQKLIDRVATHGGLTEEGVAVVRRELPGVLCSIRSAMRNRKDMIDTQIASQFEELRHTNSETKTGGN